MLYRKIFGSCKSHVRDKQSFYRRIFCCIYETDDTVECAGVREHILKVQVVIVCHTHTAKDNLIGFCTQRYVSHNLVERLVWVGKERNLLTRNQCIIQVDTSYTCSDKFRRLFSSYRVYRRTTDFNFLSFNIRTTVYRVAKSVEEASSQLFANFQCRRFSQEYHFGVCRNAFRSFKYLKCNFVTGNFNNLCQFAVYHSQFVITYSFCFQRASGLGYLADLSIYFLKSFSCHYITF